MPLLVACRIAKWLVSVMATLITPGPPAIRARRDTPADRPRSAAAQGQPGGLRGRILAAWMPQLAGAASKDAVNCPARSRPGTESHALSPRSPQLCLIAIRDIRLACAAWRICTQPRGR